MLLSDGTLSEARRAERVLRKIFVWLRERLEEFLVKRILFLRYSDSSFKAKKSKNVQMIPMMRMFSYRSLSVMRVEINAKNWNDNSKLVQNVRIISEIWL